MKQMSDFTLAFMVTLMFGTICMETDIYVPAFPMMKDFFNVLDSEIQNVISYNFIGICLGSLLFGPLSDSIGRQKTLQIGLSLFALSSWGCVFFTNFDLFLLCRFAQGFGAAAPMVASFAMFLDRYDTQKVAQLCGIVNLFIAGAMAASPMLGSVLILYFEWQYNFFVIAMLATLSLIGDLMLLEETLPLEKRLPFGVNIIKDYGKMFVSIPYIAGNLVGYLFLGGIIVFIANLSLIFIEHLGVSQEYYGFYQATIMGTFAIVSVISSWMMGKFGTEKTKYMGLLFGAVGSLSLLLVALYNPQPILICATMAIFTIGATLAMVIYCVESVNVFPNLKGVASGLSNALRHISIAAIILLGSRIFNGSILPIALLISGIFIVILFFALILRFHRST